jgi:hypothetical protein
MDNIDDLIDKVVGCAKDVSSAYEWGTGAATEEKRLDKAKAALRARIARLEADKAALVEAGNILDAALLSSEPTMTSIVAHQNFTKTRNGMR